MKQFYMKYSCLLLLVGIMAFLAGCEEEDGKFKQYVYPMPEVTSMTPGSGYAHTRVTIFGTNFGDQPKAVKVYFGGILADNILSCKNNRIVLEVPEKALSGDVSLQVWTNTIEKIGTYTILPLPTVTSLTSSNTEFGSDAAVPGDIVTIIGTGFGTDWSHVTVDFNGTAVTSGELEDTQIKVEVPEGYQSGVVTVTVNGHTLVAGTLLNPHSKGDITFAYLKNFKQPFATDPNMTEGMKGSDNKWRLPADWIVNEAARSSKNAGASEFCSGLHFGEDAVKGELILQAGWGSNTFMNGKMYQTTSGLLPAGRYRLTLELKSHELKGTSVMYFAAVKGEEMPDVTDIPDHADVVGKWQFAGTGKATESFEFVLSESSKVTIGFVGSFSSNETYFRATEIKLELL